MNSHKKHRLSLHTETHINATPEVIWQVLTDFNGYPEWNPFIASLTGEVIPGNTIHVLLQPQKGRAMKFAPKVLSFVPNREFSWLGKLGIKGVFDGEHHFEVYPHPNGGSMLQQFEHFDGILLPFLKKNLLSRTKADFERVNEAIKQRSEKG